MRVLCLLIREYWLTECEAGAIHLLTNYDVIGLGLLRLVFDHGGDLEEPEENHAAAFVELHGKNVFFSRVGGVQPRELDGPLSLRAPFIFTFDFVILSYHVAVDKDGAVACRHLPWSEVSDLDGDSVLGRSNDC